ncbi:hypothetical protein PG987_010359 [Apiospora arundinis]
MRQNFSPTQLALDPEAIFKEANHHNSFRYFDDHKANLPRLDDVSQYGVTEGAYESLLRGEISRLVEVAIQQQPNRFDSNGNFGDISEVTFEELTNLTHQLMVNTNIVQLDNNSLVLENAKSSTIITLCAMQLKERYQKLHSRYQGTAGFRVRPPEPLNPLERHRAMYFKLVDYASGSCVRLLTRVATGGNWNTTIIALFAKLSLKLKVLERDSRNNALASLENADRVVEEFEQSDEPRVVIKLNNYVKDEKMPETHIAFGNDDVDLKDIYFGKGIMLREAIHDMLGISLSAFQRNSTRKKGLVGIETCTIAYEAGLGKSNVIISQDREGQVLTTALQHACKASHAALTMLRQNFEHISDHAHYPPPQMVDVGRVHLTVDWLTKNENGNSEVFYGTIPTYRVDDMVSMLVPLCLSYPSFSRSVEEMINQIDWDDEIKDKIQWFDQPKLQARCCIQSHLAVLEMEEFNNNHLDTVPVSQSGLIKPTRVGTVIDDDWQCSLPSCSQDCSQITPFRLTKSLKDPGFPGSDKSLKEYQQHDHKTEQWIFDTVSVTVNCRRYVFTVLAVCIVIVAGGLAIPFSVGSRIDGVDPFQITSFCWLVVGVILIAAKSRYVTEWPWHDFLHGRVVCRSVCDLADVSGVDKQVILAKLLSNEEALLLKTKGPFNGMFNPEQRHGTGFSIDEPLRLSTMIASGFLILKVASKAGEHLICLDVRKPLDYAANNARDLRYLSCLDIPNRDPGGFVPCPLDTWPFNITIARGLLKSRPEPLLAPGATHILRPFFVTDAWDPLDRVIFVVDSFLALTGYGRHEVPGFNCRCSSAVHQQRLCLPPQVED